MNEQPSRSRAQQMDTALSYAGCDEQTRKLDSKETKDIVDKCQPEIPQNAKIIPPEVTDIRVKSQSETISAESISVKIIPPEVGLLSEETPTEDASAPCIVHSTTYRKRSWRERYGTSLKKFFPVRCVKSEENELPIHKAGMLSLFTFHWINSFMWKTYQQKYLDDDDLWKCPKEDNTNTNGKRFARMWKEELMRKGLKDASLGRTLFRFIRTMLLTATILNFISITFAFVAPAILFRYLLDYVRSKESNVWYGLSLVLGLFLTESGRTVTLMSQMFFGYLMGVRVRSAMMYLVFDKVLRLRSLKDKSVGEFVNFFANDCQRFLELATFGAMTLSGPATAIAGTIYCIYYIGPWALLGAAVILLYYPYQAIISRTTTYIRRKAIVVTDKRVRMITEILTCIKLIKLYAWERSFAKAVAAVRAKEKRYLQYAAYLQTMSHSINPMVPVFAAVCTFVGHILAGNELNASQAFVVVAVYNLTKTKVSVLPRLVRFWSETVVGLRRAKKFLEMTEIDDSFRRNRPVDPRSAVEIVDSTFAWDSTMQEKEEKNGGGGKRRGGGGRGKEEKFEKRKRLSRLLNGTSGHDLKMFDDLKNIGNDDKEFDPDRYDYVEGDNGQVDVDADVNNDKDDDDVNNGDRSNDVLFDINLTIEKGCIYGICGSVGSGKSSIIAAILGQMSHKRGMVSVNGTLCYVPQQAWILNSTLRENILFGLRYEKERYENVLHQCNLVYDLKWLPSGDLTEIGERGINLSGGQKQRVSLARAIYSNRDIYLLDDPLSAVDQHVGNHLFEHCLVKCKANQKTVIFVTHQLQYLSQCDHILLMKDGRIFERGTHKSLLSDDGEYANLINTYYSEINEEKTTTNVMNEEVIFEKSENGNDSKLSQSQSERSHSVDSQTSLHLPSDPGKLIEDEVKERGAVTWSTYRSYMVAAGGYCLSGVTLFMFALPVSSAAFSNWWLSHWISQGNGGSADFSQSNQSLVENSTFFESTHERSDKISDNPEVRFYAIVYGFTSVAVVVALCVRGCLFSVVTLKASSNLHDRAFSRLLRSPLSFFDVTPVGRMLNRFSKDLDEIDVRLPMHTEDLLQNIYLVLAAIIMVCIIFPWFLIALVPLAFVFWFIQIIARTTIREIKRIDNVSRSPLFSVIATSVQGLHTIHAYDKENDFLQRFKECLDKNTTAVMHFSFATRWLTVRLDLLTIVVTVVTAILVISTKGLLPPSYAGLALVYASQLTGLFQYTIRLFSEAESRFTSVERMKYYLETVKEEAADVIPNCRPPADWPKDGQIIYDGYSMRYRPKLPLILNAVSCEIRPTENIGIVGRTGSGKSSLVAALFRLTEPESGKIVIDDIDISKIGLTDLRSKLSIIPQDPILFVGTIRYNLDPFQERTDFELWKALDKCYMKNTVWHLPSDLNSTVIENGDNFSVGERQLLCLARALLRDSKILILDEATAAVDTETDARIQRTIADSFKGCTILTIAHRLNTVLHCDRIMILDKGKILEFDSPSVLLEDSNSRFFRMMHS